MRRVIVTTAVLVMLTAALSAANPIAWPPWGDITLLDSSGYSGFFEAVPGLITINVIVTGISGAPGQGVTAVQFAAPVKSCFNGVWISDTAIYPVTLGSSPTGVAIGLGMCAQTPVHVLTINLFCYGPGIDCCFLWVVPALDVPSGEIELVDCNETLYYGTGGAAIIQPDAQDCMQYVPVQKTSWGKVKSLYAE